MILTGHDVHASSSGPESAPFSFLDVMDTEVVRKFAMNNLDSVNRIAELESFLNGRPEEDINILKNQLQRGGRSFIDALKFVLKCLARTDGVLTQKLHCETMNVNARFKNVTLLA